jgi:hypothetical protein
MRIPRGQILDWNYRQAMLFKVQLLLRECLLESSPVNFRPEYRPNIRAEHYISWSASRTRTCYKLTVIGGLCWDKSPPGEASRKSLSPGGQG